MDLTEKQWELIGPLLPKEEQRTKCRGRPWQDAREVVNGILWVLRTGAPWKDIPPQYPSYQTCHRRFQQWCRRGLFAGILRVLAKDLEERGKLDLSECFIDGSFSGAKKGGPAWVQRNVGREARSWRSQSALVFLSPLTWQALRLPKYDWLNLRSTNALPKRSRTG